MGQKRNSPAHSSRLLAHDCSHTTAFLSEQQRESIVWAEDGADTCSSAEAAGFEPVRAKPAAAALDATTSFQWDGDSYRVFELLLPSPLSSVQLMLKGKSVIGSSPLSVHVLISHRVTHPTFAQHSFRYLYESNPPHTRAGKFLLQQKRLQACCLEVASLAGEPNATAACQTQPLRLWVAFKCRTTAVSQLGFTAKLHS